MVIAIPASANNMDAKVDERFGRCPYFCIVDTQSKEVVFKENMLRQAMEGVGPQVVEFLAAIPVDEVYSNEVGPKAQNILNKLNIKTKIIDAGTPIKRLINMLNN